jgi:vitamin B12 transporter
MPNKRDLITISILSLSLFALHLFSACSPALAQSEEEKNFLLMYFKPEELVVETPTRSPKPVSQVPENITVVTAADIELMNAHTLAEVLNTVTGVQVLMLGDPGIGANANIQGSDASNVTVIIDGVVLNNLSDNNVDVGLIPVQNIEKIEIIKGPASSAWGSALGGVVNIITKAGKNVDQGGMLSASYGTKSTEDFRAEARGKQDQFGYYLTAGRLQTDGLMPNFHVSAKNAYTKLTYDLTDKTNVLFALGYEKSHRGNGFQTISQLNDLSEDDTTTVQHTTVALNSSLNQNLDLNVSIRMLRIEFEDDFSGAIIENDKIIDKGYGSSAKLTWKNDSHMIVFGADADAKKLKSLNVTGGEQELRKWAVYANDTISLNRLSITPGVRYDHTSSNSAITSPSLGLAYNFANSTIVRLYTAKGFTIPPLGFTHQDNLFFSPNPDLKMEKVYSYQAGVETAALKYFWMKVSVFWNEIRDGFNTGTSSVDPSKLMFVNVNRQRRRGIDFEVKTASFYNTFLTAGTEYIEARDLDTNTRLHFQPTRVYDLGLHYNDQQSFRALLNGRYIDWNMEPFFRGSYGSFVFDLHMTKKILQHKDASLEAFADVHNLFNGSQYVAEPYKNPKRWLEGGIRYNF